MGQIVSKLSTTFTGGMSNIFRGSRKRRLSADSDDVGGKDNEQSQPPIAKRKKLLTTTQYIHQVLFREQKNSDVVVMALGRVWRLHKIYLAQSPYFHSMFNGLWREAYEQFVHIRIEDERITEDALDAVFSSLYSDEIDISPTNVVSILATATLFHMDSIIERCSEIMTDNINRENAIEYYECACRYGSLNVKKKAFQWLETNLLQVYSKYRKALSQISVELMTALVSSSELFVMQTEFSLYALLRTWIYLKLHPDYDPDQVQVQPAQLAQSSQLAEAAQQQRLRINSSIDVTNANMPLDVIQSYFTDRPKNVSFLATSEGQPYLKPLQALRTQYLATHHMDLNAVLTDNIIPKEWLHSHALSHWHAILKVDHSTDEGPRDLDPDVFSANCMRCARSLPEPGYQKWRWTGFNFGLDLILILDSRLLRIRRHHRNEHERLLSLQTTRQFMIRVTVASINAQRQPIQIQKSDILSLSLEKNEEATIMTLDANIVHPILISLNLLVVPPTVQTVKEQILLPPCEDVANLTLPISEISADYPLGDQQQQQQQEQEQHNNHGSVAVCDVSVPSVPTPPSTSSVATNTESNISIRRLNNPGAGRRLLPASSVFLDSSQEFI